MYIVYIKYFLECEFYSMSKFNNQRALTSVYFQWMQTVAYTDCSYSASFTINGDHCS